jgi:Zn-dependent protease with chaperone function
LFLLGPLLAFTWRTRCYLADATAVQLTRNPDGLARALVQLLDTGALIPGSQGVSHLFIVGAEVSQGRSRARMQAQLMKMRDEARTEPDSGVKLAAGMEMAQLLIAQSQTDAELEAGTFEEKQGIVVSFHPQLSRRLKRLAELGAMF